MDAPGGAPLRRRLEDAGGEDRHDRPGKLGERKPGGFKLHTGPSPDCVQRPRRHVALTGMGSVLGVGHSAEPGRDSGDLKPRQMLEAEITSAEGKRKRVPLLCRIDTLDELDYYRNGGILHYVLRQLAA